MQVIKFVRNTVLLVSLVSVAASCNPFKAKKEKSTATGWNYNDQQYGNFNVVKPKDIKTAPGLGFCTGWYLYHGCSAGRYYGRLE
jgi:sulfatase modifying factor 1